MYCNFCGKSMPDDAVHCSYCGRRIGVVFAQRKLQRPREGRKIAGVCAGFAQYLDLDVTLVRLHQLLDAHIFNDGSARPAGLTFRACDLILLKFWDRGPDDHKVIRMPLRRA